ncbi:MAG: hypothetical protein L0H41_00155 [Microlunatus sp.]|nr:hypothetical protein [Microlunatus sp.]MDN5804689.1 hypothetical protein [Microlunatus sp.]
MSVPELPPSSTSSQQILRWVLAAVGVAGIGYGAYLTLGATPTWPERISTGLWLLVPPVLNDVILLPLAAVVGWLIVRRLSRPWRDVVVVALVLSVFALLIGWPFISGYGRLANNPSLLDRNYIAGAAALLAVIWIGCLLAGAVLTGRERRVSQSDAP